MGLGCACSCTLSSFFAEKDLECSHVELRLRATWQVGGAVAHAVFLGGMTPSSSLVLLSCQEGFQDVRLLLRPMPVLVV